MVVDFSKINLKERPMLVLKTQSDEVIQTLGYAFNVEADLMYNEVSTLTFDLPAYVSGVKTPNYDEVKGTRIIDFVGVGLFILVDPTTENDGVSEIKHCKAYSLEYEFTKKQFYIAGNEEDPDEDGNVGYKMVYNFYDGVSGASNTDTIIGRIHEKMPEWTFDVDPTLIGKYRTFDSDVSDNVYNFIKSTVQETYGCIFNFDTYNRTVTVISTESTVAQRQVYLSQENLIKTINIDEDSDSVVTSLDVSGEEGVSIRFVNPTGQNNIYDLHYFLDELPASLRTKWNEWTATCEAQRQNYFNLAMSYQVKIADILTEEVKLVDLEGELKSAETVQGAEVSKPDHKQSDLDNANAEVTRATNAVNAQKSVVNTKMAQKNSILNSIQSINYSLAWEPVRDKNGNIIGGPWKDSHNQAFTANELKILRRYFFEDSVEDSSFALATTNSYTNKDVGSGLKNITINITNDSRKIERANSSSLVYSFAGGKIMVGTIPNYLSAKIVRGTAEVDPSTNKVILTAYLERGDYSQTDFEDEGTGRTIFDCGTITLTGTYTKMSYNGSTTQEGIYAGTSLFLEGANVQVYFSKNTSEFEQYSVEWDLFNYGKEILQERSEPSYTFNVEAGNFLVIDDYFTFQNDLKLGQRVFLNLDGTMKTPYVTSVHVNYEDLSDFKIEFCNTYRASDSSFRLSQLLEQSIRLGKSLNIKGGMYSQFQATGAQNAVREFMNSALDIAKNNVLSSENQAITFDESGLRLRKWKDKDAGTYEDEQIWMNDNTIAFTDDNWSTAKMAIGKIIDPNISGTGEAYGIAAPYLVGTVLAGSNLVITANNHSFKIDGNGIRINTDSLLITNSKGEDVTFTQTIKNAQDEALSESGKRLKDLMSTMDDEMNVFNPFGYSDALPTYAGGARDGDLILYRDSDNRKRTVTVNGKPITLTSGYLYRIQMSGTTIKNLEEIPDKSLADAVEAASNFQDTVDGKSVVYARTTPPGSGADESSMIEDVDHGDLWICTLPVGQSASHDLVKGGTYSGGKMYRWNGDKNTSYYRKWILVEDPDIDRKATALGNTMKELMQVLDPNDTDMNLYRMEQNDVFDTITAGAENGDLLYFVGTSQKTVTINGKSQTLNPDSLYRIVVSGGKITALNEETDEATVAAIKSASNFQNFTDYKSTVYAQRDPPVKDKAGITLDANDDGDIWFCTRPTEGDDSSAKSSRVDDGTGATQGTYRGGKMYRYSHPKWVVVEDPFISDFNAVFDSISGLREELDDKVVTFYQNTEPTKAENGDLWYYNGTANIKIGSTTITKGKVYRLKVSGTTRVWEELTDPKIQQAIENAALAQNTADGKAQTWWTATPPEPQEGDDGDLWYCTLSKGSSGYSDLVDEAKDDKNKNYYGGRLYYCKIVGYNREEYSDGTAEDVPILKWKLCDDKVLAAQIETTANTLNSIYQDGALVKDKFPKTIEAQYMAMKAAGGNVVYDSYGVWLLDKATNGTSNTNKVNATEAVWMNEDGILFGHSARTGDVSSDYEKEMSATESSAIGLSNKKWYWTTAISHEGITAKALLGQILQGVHILGDSDLKIGTTDGVNYRFIVDKNGNVTANNGTFKGTLYANDIKTPNGTSIFKSGAGTNTPQIDSKYLELYGITVKDPSTDNVVMTINSNGVSINKGSISWGSIDTTGSNIAYKTDIPDEQDLSDYAKKTYVEEYVPSYMLEGTGGNLKLKGTYIDNMTVASLHIFGGEFCSEDGYTKLVLDDRTDSISGIGAGMQLRDTSNQVYFSVKRDGLLFTSFSSMGKEFLHVLSIAKAYVEPRGEWDFTNATVTGITATFG